jgi:hypothetical protein
LQLHQLGVGGGPAVDGTHADVPGRLAYRHQEVIDLEGNGLKRGARHVFQPRPQGQPGQQARGRWIPPGRAEPVETRNEVHPVRFRIRRDRREPGGGGRRQLGEPGQGGPAGPDVAFDGPCGLSADLPGNRLAEPGLRVSAARSGGHDGRPGPVGRLDQARSPAGLAEQRCVRVAHDGQDRHLDRECLLIEGQARAERPDGADDVRERLGGHAEQVKEVRGPPARLDVHQLGA